MLTLAKMFARRTFGDEVLYYKLCSFLLERTTQELVLARLAQFRAIDDYVKAHRRSRIGAPASVGAIFTCRATTSCEMLAAFSEPLRIPRDTHLCAFLGLGPELHLSRLQAVVERELGAAELTYAKALGLAVPPGVASPLLRAERRLFAALASSAYPAGKYFGAPDLHLEYAALNRFATLRAASVINPELSRLYISA